MIEWLEMLVEKTGRFSTEELDSRIGKMDEFCNNPTTQAIDIWLDSVLGGYVIEFAVDCIQSYSVVEREFFKGLCGRLLKSLNAWIKMLLREKHVMVMKFDC
jgi:hypothetical protein